MIFIHLVFQVYHQPFGEGGVRATVEHRFSLDGDRLIRHVRTQKVADEEEDLSVYDPSLPVLLENARIFAACAAAQGAEPPECVAPRP